MRKSVISLLVLLAVFGCLFMAGCIGEGNETTPTPTPTPTQPVTDIAEPVTTYYIEKNRIDIYPGESVRSVLPSNPTTGYDWVIIESQEQNVTQTYIPDAETAGLAGAGGVTEFLMEMKKPGSYKFIAHYVRPWETDVEPLAVFSQYWVVSAPIGEVSDKPILSITCDGKVNPSPGDVIKIVVEGNPTTGYEWSPAEGIGLKLLDEKYTPTGTESMVGSGGVYEWLLTAETPGTHVFGAEYKRSWEDEPANMFWFDIIYT